MNKQKSLWEALARENSKYYINSDKGRGITEEEFRKSGMESYRKLISEDTLIKKGGFILDFGCGNGRLMEFMSPDFTKVIGVDISPTMIDEGRRRLKDLTNVEFVETDGESIPLPGNYVDVVFSYLVFQHIKERRLVESAFKEINRILVPGGLFKVLLRSDRQENMEKWWSGVEYDEEAAKKLYGDAGFGLIKREQVDPHAYWLWLEKQK